MDAKPRGVLYLSAFLGSSLKQKHPKRAELRQRLIDANLPAVDINELKEKTERITGIPQKPVKGERVVAKVIGRDGNLLGKIYSVSNEKLKLCKLKRRKTK